MINFIKKLFNKPKAEPKAEPKEVKKCEHDYQFLSWGFRMYDWNKIGGDFNLHRIWYNEVMFRCTKCKDITTYTLSSQGIKKVMTDIRIQAEKEMKEMKEKTK